jgi:hypothetical protein
VSIGSFSAGIGVHGLRPYQQSGTDCLDQVSSLGCAVVILKISLKVHDFRSCGSTDRKITLSAFLPSDAL